MSAVDHAAEAARLLAGHKAVLEQAKAKLAANPHLDGRDMQAAFDMSATLLETAQVHATLAVAQRLGEVGEVLETRTLTVDMVRR